jgi:hypothetical protein
LRPRVKQIEEVGVFLLDDYANTRALAAMWLSAIGRDAVHALRSITLYQASDFDDEGRDDIANALEAIRKNIGANEERPSRVVARQSAH